MGVIIKFCGDEWGLDEKIVASLDAAKTFASQQVQIRNKLGVPDLSACCLYHTEKTADGVRATTPISLTSSVSREKLKMGNVIWVKTDVNLEQQRRDVEFHESLLNFRKQSNAGGKAAAGDVDAFLHHLETNLNVKTAKDACDHEAEWRLDIDKAEFRAFLHITLEYREVEGMKADELKARHKLFDATRAAINASYAELVGKPLYAEKHAVVDRAQAVQRVAVLRAEEVEHVTLVSGMEQQGRAVAAGAQQRQLAEQQRLMMEANAAAVAAAQISAGGPSGGVGGGGGGGVGIAPEELQRIVSAAVAQATLDTAAMMKHMEVQLSQQMAGLEGHVAAETAGVKDMMNVMLRQRNDTIEDDAAARGAETDDLVARHSHRVAGFEHRAADFHPVVTDDPEATAAAREEIADLLSEQNRLLTALAGVEEDDEAAQRQSTEAAERGMADGVIVAMQSVQQALQRSIAELAEGRAAFARARDDHARAQLGMSPKERAAAAAEKDFEWISQCRVAPDGTDAPRPSVGWRLKPSRLAPANRRGVGLHRDVAEVLLSFARRHGIVAADERLAAASPSQPPLPDADNITKAELEFVDDADPVDDTDADGTAWLLEMTKQHRSPWAIADRLAAVVGVQRSPKHGHVARLCATHSPHYEAVLDLLLHEYAGREVELSAVIVSGGLADAELASRLRSRGRYTTHIDAASRRFYYHHDILDSTQWLRPACLDGADGNEAASDDSDADTDIAAEAVMSL
jgi:hypothetical protein